MVSYVALFLFSSSVILLSPSDAFFSWIFKGGQRDSGTNDFDSDKKVPVPEGEVPFEMTTTDEKFLAQQHSIKDLSPLDTCQHLVISELKSTCTSLTEEELGKLAVQLLNCQSSIEGRTTFSCTKEMTIGECTKEMDATTWNAYQIVSNRARAICYSTRQQQFRKKAEFTVNRLLETTEGQILAMKHIKEGQERINDATAITLEKMEIGQKDLLARHEGLKSSQMNIQTYIASNLRELVKEKSLIAAGNKELAQMTDSIKQKLEVTTKKLEAHEESQKHNHQEVLSDLSSIREKAREVWSKIDESSKNILKYHNDNTHHYEDTLENLRRVNSSITHHYADTLENLQRVNATITNVLNTIATLEDSVERKLGWISTHLGGTGDRLLVLSTVTLHALYFLLAAVCVSFLQTPQFSRIVLLLLVPLNAWSEVKHSKSLGFTAMTLFILLIVIVNWIAEWVFKRYYGNRPESTGSPRSSISSLSDLGSPGFFLAPRTSPETPEVAGRLNGLNSPDIRKLVLVLESLCKQGLLSPTATPHLTNSPSTASVNGGSPTTAPVRVESPSAASAHVSHVSEEFDSDSEGSDAAQDSSRLSQPLNGSAVGTVASSSTETPHTAQLGRRTFLSEGYNSGRDLTDSDKVSTCGDGATSCASLSISGQPPSTFVHASQHRKSWWNTPEVIQGEGIAVNVKFKIEQGIHPDSSPVLGADPDWRTLQEHVFRQLPLLLQACTWE